MFFIFQNFISITSKLQQPSSYKIPRNMLRKRSVVEYQHLQIKNYQRALYSIIKSLRKQNMITQESQDNSFLQKADSLTATSQLQLKQLYAGIESEYGLEGFEKQSGKLQKTNRNSSILKDQNFQDKSSSQNCLTSSESQQGTSLHIILQQSTLKFDLAILELDNQKRQYNCHILKETLNSGLIEQISQLVLSDLESHVRIINLIEMDLKTKRPSPICNPLIIPLVGGQKTAFIYSNFQYMKNGAFFEQSQRFYIFICEEFLPFSFSNLVKNITKLEYQDRLRIDNGKYSMNYYTCSLFNRKRLLNQLSSYLEVFNIYQFSSMKSIKNERMCQFQWYVKHICDYKLKIKVEERKVVQVSIFVFLLYFCLKDHKVIMIGTPQTNWLMSQLIIALKNSLSPIYYSNPIIFASITQNHVNYLDAPMPSILSLWGQQDLCSKLIKQRKQMLHHSNQYDTPSIVIDLNKKLGYSSIKHYQMESLKRLDNIMKMGIRCPNTQTGNIKVKRMSSMIQKANYFIFRWLLGGQSQQFKDLAFDFKNSTIYCNNQPDRIL